MNQYIFTYWDGIAKVMLVIDADTLTKAIGMFLQTPTASNIDEAITFSVKKVQP
jgi:hypothetical protein